MNPETARKFGQLAPGDFVREPHATRVHPPAKPPKMKKEAELRKQDLQIMDFLFSGHTWKEAVHQFRCGSDRIARIIKRNGVQEVLKNAR